MTLFRVLFLVYIVAISSQFVWTKPSNGHSIKVQDAELHRVKDNGTYCDICELVIGEIESKVHLYIFSISIRNQSVRESE